MEKTVLSIRVSYDFYNKLKSNIPRGKIGAFIEEVVEKRLIQKENRLGDSYQECYTKNPHLLDLAKQWEKAESEDWLNYEREKNNK